jgi:hypothetical protein
VKKTNLKKDPLEFDEKEEIAVELLAENKLEKQNKILNTSLDKVLATHRNTRLFLFMLTGPFFAFFMVFKYTIKAILLIYLYKKRKANAADLAAKQAPSAGD